MTYYITPVLGMSLANPGTGQAFETAVVNNDFTLIDTAIGADRSRIVVVENRDGIVADLDALVAIASPASGWTRIISEGGAQFYFNGTGWFQKTPALFGSLAQRDTAYAKASGSFKVSTAQVRINATGFLLTQWFAATSTWRIVEAGRAPITPATLGGTGVTLVGNKVNFVNNSGDMTLYNIFTDDFDLYDITIAWQGAGSSLVIRAIDDVAVIDSASVYGTTTLLGNGATASSIQSALASAITIVSGAFINGNFRLRVSFARQTQAALFEFEGTAYLAPASGVAIKGGSRRNISAKVGGLDFQFSAAASGYVIVEGVRG